MGSSSSKMVSGSQTMDQDSLPSEFSQPENVSEANRLLGVKKDDTDEKEDEDGRVMPPARNSMDSSQTMDQDSLPSEFSQPENVSEANLLLGVKKDDTVENEDEGGRVISPTSLATKNLNSSNPVIVGGTDENGRVIPTASTRSDLDSSTSTVDVNTAITLLQNSSSEFEEKLQKMDKYQLDQNQVVIDIKEKVEGMRKGIGRQSHDKKTEGSFRTLLLATTLLIGYNIALFQLGRKCLNYVAILMGVIVLVMLVIGWATISTMMEREDGENELTERLNSSSPNTSGGKFRYMPTIGVCLFGIGHTLLSYFVLKQC